MIRCSAIAATLLAAVVTFASPVLAKDSPIVTTGSPKNPAVAAKAVTLTKLVFQRGWLRSTNYSINRLGNGAAIAKSIVFIDGWRWTVLASNYDEKKDKHDIISIWGRPDTATEIYADDKGTDERDLNFADISLDGNLDNAVIPAALSGTGNAIEMEFDANGVWTNRAAFQQRYDEAVNTLIAYYKQDK